MLLRSTVSPKTRQMTEISAPMPIVIQTDCTASTGRIATSVEDIGENTPTEIPKPSRASVFFISGSMQRSRAKPLGVEPVPMPKNSRQLSNQPVLNQRLTR